MAEQFPETPDVEPLSRTQILIAMGVTAVMLLLVAKVWLRFDSAVTLLPLKWSAVAILEGLGLGVLITLASSIVYRVWGTYRRSADYYLQLVLKPLIWLDVIWLGLLPGLSEELLFRGVMLPAFGLDTIGVALSSLCFGVLHLSTPKQWSYVIWATIVGAGLGVSALITGNLLVPIVAHIFTNLISSCLWKWDDYRKQQPT
ncbi:CPBP family intramembrane metalloprotease [Leptolyngbya sp. FACHB-36]|uniref:CPBP family intramembrane glutamic endopeptidase n=1 Tax=Leptolyngbya sp. FACHB-36 TaxID=2692808 RepID=UPI00167FE4F2|nr:CPBP family intramembrane metalloprotease [Leptolyngbya sp. FACHB-36]